MTTGPIHLHTNNEQPSWVVTVTTNGAAVDCSTGWTFTCKVIDDTLGTTLVTKSTGITGSSTGWTVAFTGAELVSGGVTATFANDNVRYRLQSTATRTSDGARITADEVLVMHWTA